MTWDETAEPISRDQIPGANGDREIFIFPVQLTTSRTGNLYMVDPYSASSSFSGDHTHTHNRCGGVENINSLEQCFNQQQQQPK